MNEALRDAWPCLQCGQCQHFKVRAEMEGVESSCKRLDHKHIRFAVPWFKSYDCGQHGGAVCDDFTPREDCKYLYEHWTGFYDYWGPVSDTDLLGLVLDGETSVRWYVRYKDFVEGTFLDDAGNLKWVKKMYYKQCKKTPRYPTDYKLMVELPDGTVHVNGEERG